MIKIKREQLDGSHGLALYYNGERTHMGLFTSMARLRAYWKSFRRDIISGNSSFLIFGTH